MLTYDIIVNYLMPVVNKFSQHPNISLKSSEFTYFNKIFDDTFYRYGINYNDEQSNNVSLKSSILYCLDENYHNIQLNQINNIITPNDITNCVKELNINIIIFDFKNNKISSEYFGDYFNPWRPTILLANYEEYYEPIVIKECKIFSFSSCKSNILKNNILSQQIYKYNTEELININDNFKEILELENFNKSSSGNNDTFTSSEEAPPNKSKLDKMKKDELIQLCAKLNKSINIARPTKKDLIEIILN
jgi:hypothetical protein